MKKQLLALFIIFTVCFCLLPITVLAEENHTHGDAEIFGTPISTLQDLQKLFADGGSGYLTEDIVNEDKPFIINNKEVSLCLCGHVINLNAKGNIQLINGALLKLYDCMDTDHKFDTSEAQWRLDEAAEDTVVKGGVITNGTGGNGETAISGAGGAFNLSGGSKLMMYGGNLVGNRTSAGGGAVYVNKNCEFSMLGGSIMGNVSDYYGGGVCNTGGRMIMLAGRISNNTNTYSNGNNGGGIYVKNFSDANGTVEFGGTAVVEGNLYKNGEASDVYNDNGKLSVAQSPNAPSEGMRIGILQGEIEGAVSGQESYFFLNNSDKQLRYSDEGGKIIMVDIPHVHSEGTAEEIVFEARIENLQELQELFAEGGSGYLTEDILNGDRPLLITGKEVSLCLCGHVINLNAKGNIQLGENAVLKLYDCMDTEHRFNTSEAQWRLDEAAGDKIVKGGIITNGTGGNGKTAISGAGGAFNLNGGSKLMMYGGNLVGNRTSAGGGAVYVNKNCEFSMLGGSIMGNVSDYDGGGVNNTGGKMIMLAGRISNNTNTYSGGNNGGGIYVKSLSTADGTVEFGGSAVVEGNLYKNGEASDVYTDNGKLSVAQSPNAPSEGMRIGILQGEIKGVVRGQESFFFADSDSKYLAFNDNGTEDNTDDDYLELCDITDEPAEPDEHPFAILIPQQDATTSRDGVKSYWYCGECRLFFEDASNQLGKLIGTTEDLNVWKTGVGKIKRLTAHEHAYGAATYIWHEDMAKCTAYKTCSCGNAVIETVVATKNDNMMVADFSSAFSDQSKQMVTPQYTHEHKFSNEWRKNEINHWHEATCEHTDITRGLSTHQFGKDDVCDTCGYKRVNDTRERVVLSFNTQYGSYVDTQVVYTGEKAKEPTRIPVKENCIFNGWYTDSTFSQTFDFDTALIADTTVYADWIELPILSANNNTAGEEDSIKVKQDESEKKVLINGVSINDVLTNNDSREGSLKEKEQETQVVTEDNNYTILWILLLVAVAGAASGIYYYYRNNIKK